MRQASVTIALHEASGRRATEGQGERTREAFLDA
jgi:hypothetical protein